MKHKVLLTVFGFFGIFLTLFFVQQSLQNTLTPPITTPLTSTTSSSNTALNNTTVSRSKTNKNTTAPIPQHTATSSVSLKDHETQVLSDFKAWLNSKNKHSTLTEWKQQGQDLAQQRQTIMQTLMQTQPQQALAQSVTFQQYAALPKSIKNLVEQPFSKQVELVVLPNESQHKNSKEMHEDHNQSYIKFDQQRLRVYRYGQRNAVLSKQNLAVQGIILGKEAAIYDQALIPIAPTEAAYIQQHFSEPNQNSNANKTDFYTGKPIQGNAVLALAGGKILPFASSTNLQQLNTQLARLEQINHPQSTARVLEKYTQASHTSQSNTVNTEPLSQYLEKLLAKGSDWTTTVKKVLLIRVITADASGTAVTQAALHTALTNSSELIKKISHNKTSLDVTVSSQSFTLSKNTASYSGDGGAGELLTEAKALFSAANGSVDLDSYDVVGVHIGGERLSVDWAGLASVGGGNYWLNNTINLGTVTHEFGHIYGLSHANFWETNNVSVVGTGNNEENEEYGDKFDIMGSGSAPAGYFHPQALAKLTWLAASTDWTDITTSGKYRVNRFDHESATGVRGLRIARNGGTSDGYYWLGYRQNFDNNNYLENGAYLIWEQADAGQSWLIDTTPASFVDKNADKNDAGVVLGQTYSDTAANIYITTLAKGGTAPNEWLDIQVNLGNTANNAAPTVSLTLPTTLTARTPLTFTATASDSDGDNLSYQWDFGDGVIHPNSASVTQTWTVGGTYTVKITVSDMKGKTATAQKTITVADPLTQWTQRTSNTSEDLHDIASDGTMLVAVGKPVLSSSDGQTWTQLKDKIGTNVILKSIVYSGSQWVAVGSDYDFSTSKWIGVIYTSNDASTWVERYKGEQELNKIAVGNNTLVAVGDSGTILSSADGISWTTRTSGVSTTLRDIAFGDNTFVIVGGHFTGNDVVVLNSTDGSTWNNHSTGAGVADWQNLNTIEYLNQQFISSGWFSKIRYSIDKGQSFQTTRKTTEIIPAFAFGDNIYFAAGIDKEASNAKINLVSIDGKKWTKFSTSATNTRNAAIFFKNTFITVGDKGSIRQSDAVTASTSIVDTDKDTIADSSDNCPNIANLDQADLDKDNIGDVCDADRDGDGIDNDQDPFPDNGAESVDTDGDGVGDKSDNCPTAANADQADDDKDGLGNVCEPVTANSVKRAFPQHVSYAANTIRPTNFTQTEQDKHVSDFYDYWKSHYLIDAGTNSTGKTLYRIAFGKTDTKATITVSEGQGYGMEIVALMAGYDTNAQKYFDGLWRFTRKFPSGINSALMSWKIENNQIVEGNDSAFDGDADIAYGLLLADAQWGSTGAINYKAEAVTVIQAILSATIGESSRLPLLGDWVDDNDTKYNQYTPRSSDFMPAHFRSFGRATGDTTWNTVVANSQAAIDTVQALSSNTTGLLPDFIVDCNPVSHCKPSNGQFLESSNDEFYYYNAGRDPLRMGLDALLNGDTVSHSQVKKMLDWLVTATSGQVSNIKAGYRLDGTVIDSSYSTSFFTAPFGVAAMLDPTQQNFLNDIYNAVYNQQEDYYEDSVNLLSLLVMTGNYWEAVPAVIDPNDTDADGIANTADNCPDIANPNQLNQDNDAQGDVCDVDKDGDTINNTSDNCPNIANTNQTDLDKDNIGDVCDADRDGDGVANAQDAFPDNGAESVDTDGDSVGDKSDNCPTAANADQADDDKDGLGNVCDSQTNIIELSGSLATYLNNINYGVASENTWIKPNATRISQFKQVFSDFLAGNYDAAQSNALPLGYELIKYTNTDSSATDIHYILRESATATFTGGGTYLLYPTGKNAVLQIPHPKFDSNTAIQGIETYLKVRPRLLMLAGTRRDNSTAKSACTDGNYFDSDVSHQTQSLFYAAHQVASDADKATVFIQFHGFGSTSLGKLQTQCASSNPKLINLSEGINYATPESENSLLHILRKKVDTGGLIKVCVYGNDTTSLGGTYNVEGRYSNRSNESCSKNATVSSKRFIHLEQSYDVRADHRGDMANYINQALTEYLSLIQSPTSSDSTTLLGVYHGNQGWAMNDVQALETWQSKKQAILTLFTNFNPAQQNNLMTQQLPNIWNNGNIPLISWEPFLETVTTPASIEADIAKGDYDTYLTTWINALKVFLMGTDGILNTADDRRVYLRLAHEMNGNWYPWSAINANESTQDYIAMWQHIHDLFTHVGLQQDHVQWIWSVSASDHNAQTRMAEHYYPGDSYVDWLGVDGYNFGTSTTDPKWRTPTKIFTNMVNRLRLLAKKPIAINETGAQTDTGTNIAEKNVWIEQLFAYIHSQNIQMLSWFNTDKEKDWAIFAGAYGNVTASGGEKAYLAYQTGVQSEWMLSADSNNPRLLNQTLFSGGMSHTTTDSDGDTIIDSEDNCPNIANTNQLNQDGDSLGDICDADRDGDGIDNNQDPFPDDATVDSDGDGFGDTVDVFPQDPSEWLDTDNDGIGDNADQFPNDPDKSKDSDNDGIDDSSDNCPLNSNTGQEDKDNNGKGDVCDIATDTNASSAELTPIIDIYDDWGTGFCADVVVRNTTSTTVDWTAKFKPDATITSVWGALISAPNDGVVTAEGVSYNNTLTSQASTHFGYCAKRTLDTSVIESLSAEVEYPNSEDDWSWEGGYCATVKVKNDQDHVIDWTTSFTLPTERQGTITSFWDGTYTLEGNTLTVAGVSWNNWLLPDQFTTFGFCINTDSSSESGDTTPPEVTAPDALTGNNALKSKTFLTAFRLAQLGTATADDDTDGSITARILSVDGDDIRLKNNKILLQSGRHLIVWYAEDQAGNRGIAQQYVDVLPRANFVVNQSSSEGKMVTVEAWLNGDAPSYPVEIPFTLDSNSSTADSTDYQISSHTISIDQLQAGDNQENPHGTVTVNLVDDGEQESTETIVFKMDKDKLKNAVAGKKRRHKIKILNENAAPKAKLKVSQGTKKGRKVEQSNDNVTIKAEAKDPNGDTLSYDWSKTPQALIDIPESPNDDPATFVFNPSNVALGKYKIRVAISDGQKTINKKKRIKVIAAKTISTTADTDNDGILDADESGDLNENGIPDYLEAPHDEHELPSDADGSTFLSGEPGTALGLGSIAFDSDNNSCTITEAQIQAYLAAQGLPTYQEDSGFKADKIFDYEIGSLEGVGSTSQIVLSLASPLTAQSVIRKYSINQGTWSAFSEDANNKLESLINTEGNCPDDEETVWSTGLVVGGTCLRLTIEDGGPNDADGEANGEIDDPVAITTQQSTGGGSTGGGSTGGGSTTTPVVIVESNHINYFKLAIAQPLDIDASVDYTTRDGTAIAGQDYIATKGTAVIPAGKTQVLIPVEILADSTNETDEHFSLVLSNPVGGIFPIGTTEMSVSHTIIDDSSVNESFYEGSSNHNNYFKLELNQVMETDASIAYTTRDGTAIAGQDYIATTGTATIKAGQTRLLIPVEIIADSIAEADETFSLVITNPTGGVFPAGTSEIVSTHTIVNDD